MHSVYLVRHGKSSMDGSEAERGLEPEGEEHAKAIAARLQSLSPPVKAIYASPYRRAQFTMTPLSEQLGVAITVIDDFREKDMSDQPIDDMKAARLEMWQDFDSSLPGGESIHAAQARALAALDTVRQSHPDEAVAIGSRGDPSRTMQRIPTPGQHSIEQISEFLGVASEQCIKTLLVKSTEESVVALLLRGDHEQNTIKAEKQDLVASPMELASNDEIQAVTG